MATPFNYTNPSTGVPVAGSTGTGGEAVQTVEIATVSGGVSTRITPAQDGTDATGVAAPAGAVGIRGWLSGIFNRLAPGRQLMAASLPVAIASDQAAVPVSGTFWQGTQPVSGTVTANAGTGTMAVDAIDRAARLLGHVTVDTTPDGPSLHTVTITPSDTVSLAANTRGIYVGASGDITLDSVGGETAVLFKAVPGGTVLPVQAQRVRATGTTAANLVALY